jgi:hypothetical protein
MVNRYFSGGHSLYFTVDGKADDRFINTYWLDCFSNNPSIKATDNRESSIGVSIKSFMCNIGGFFKEASYIFLTVYLLYIFLSPLITYSY